jgi:hypothetical protein
MDRDSQDCWLHSVEEAKKHRSVFWQSLGKITQYFKQKSKIPPKSPVEVVSSSLSPSNVPSSLTEVAETSIY